MHQLRAKQPSEANMSRMMEKGVVNRMESVLIPLYKSLGRPHLKDSVQLWSPHLQKDPEELEKGKQDDRGHGGASHEETLKRPGLFIPEETLEGARPGQSLQSEAAPRIYQGASQ